MGFVLVPFCTHTLGYSVLFILRFQYVKPKGKNNCDESNEEIEDSYPNLFGPNDPLCSSRGVGPSYHRDTFEYPRPMTTLPSPDLEPVGNRGGPASGSGENHSSKGAGVPEESG